MKSTSPFKTIVIAILVQLAAASHGAESFSVKVSGEGSPIILIPGLACDGSVWDETVARYSGSHELHTLSLAGFGGHPPIALDGTFLDKVAKDLVAYLESERIQKPVIVGHSLGGFIALKLACEHPDLPSALVIVDSVPFLPAVYNPAATVESSRAYAAQTRDNMRSGSMNPEAMNGILRSMITSPANIDRAAKLSLASDGPTVAQAMYELSTVDLRADIAKITAPTLVLGAWIGYQSYGATRESTEALFRGQYAALPNCRLEMTDKGKHFIMWDDPEFFYEQLDSVVAKSN